MKVNLNLTQILKAPLVVRNPEMSYRQAFIVIAKRMWNIAKIRKRILF